MHVCVCIQGACMHAYIHTYIHACIHNLYLNTIVFKASLRGRVFKNKTNLIYIKTYTPISIKVASEKNDA